MRLNTNLKRAAALPRRRFFPYLNVRRRHEIISLGERSVKGETFYMEDKMKIVRTRSFPMFLLMILASTLLSSCITVSCTDCSKCGGEGLCNWADASGQPSPLNSSVTCASGSRKCSMPGTGCLPGKTCKHTLVGTTCGCECQS